MQALTQRCLPIALGAAVLLAGGCGGPAPEAPGLDAAWFTSEHWADGAADVSVYEGRVKKYGAWRDAEIRDYVVREFLHPDDLVKRDEEGPALIGVLKTNRLTTFSTGAYDYRLMASLFFERRTARLVKGVGSSQEACGLTFQRWDRNTGLLQYDSYWEGEARGSLAVRKDADGFFPEELPYVARSLPQGMRVRVLPALTANRVQGWKEEPRVLTVEKRGPDVRLILPDGETWARFDYDDDGAIRSWTIRDQETFDRTSKEHSYYWQEATTGGACDCADAE